MSIVGARVLTEPELSLAAIAHQLEELGLGALDADPSVSVPVVLSWSYRALTEKQKTMFVLLGIAPGEDIGLPAAAGLAGVSTEDARETLRSLEQASLLSIGDGFRARMHDLVRAYATERARHVDSSAALRRLLDHYVHTAHANDRLIDPHRPVIALPAADVPTTPAADKAGALAWFDAERGTRQAVQQAAAQRGWNDGVLMLARVSHAYNQHRGHLDDELTLWGTAIDAADDPNERVVAHRIMGSSLGQVQRYDEAQHHLDEALVLAKQIGEPLPLADAYGALTWLWVIREEYQRAFDHARAALSYYQQTGNQVLIALAHNNFGYCAAEIGDTGQGREHAEKARALLHELGDRQGEAAAVDTLARIAHQVGDHTEAVSLFENAAELYRAENDDYTTANVLVGLGHPLLALELREQAEEVWRQALAMLEQQGRDDEADRVRKQLAAIHVPPGS